MSRPVASPDAPAQKRGPYAALTLTHALLLGGFLLLRRRQGKELPERIGVQDIAIIGLATQRTSRTISKDKVTEPFRAPFTEPQGSADAPPGETEESPRRESGVRYAIGELLLCP